MVLVFSDLHLGRDQERSLTALKDLQACIESIEAPKPSEIVFLGDIFDAFLEYPGTVSDIVEQFRRLVIKCICLEIQISYHVGNHDLWHLTYFDDIQGLTLYRQPIRRQLESFRAFLSHGDEAVIRPWWGRTAHWLMRSRTSYWLYRHFLPRSVGQTLPAWMSRTFADPEPNPKIIWNLKHRALEILRNTSIDLVIFGHSHAACIERGENGTYLNPGAWFIDRSFAEIRDTHLELKRWSPTD